MNLNSKIPKKILQIEKLEKSQATAVCLFLEIRHKDFAKYIERRFILEDSPLCCVPALESHYRSVCASVFGHVRV